MAALRVCSALGMARLRSITCIVLALSAAATSRVMAADSLVWRTAENRVDAQGDGRPPERGLQPIPATRGWQVYVEPGTEHTVTTRFTDLKPADALLRLLGELNFALLPRAGGPSALFVYRHSVSQATQLVHAPQHPRGGKPIGNELIVTLKRGSNTQVDSP